MSDGATETSLRELRVASYNVHRCVGIDGRYDPARVATVIGELGASVIGLQEVDSHYHFKDGVDQIEQLQRLTGLSAVPGPTLLRHDASYGNALLTQRAVADVRRVDLSVAWREPRGALDVDLEWQNQILRVITTHFGLGPRERVRQTATLLRMLDHHTQPLTIVLGDFNEWVPMRSILQQLHRRLGRSRAVRTFPAPLPALKLDRIWVQPRAGLVRIWAHRSALARVASDHLPVCATLRLPG